MKKKFISIILAAGVISTPIATTTSVGASSNDATVGSDTWNAFSSYCLN